MHIPSIKTKNICNKSVIQKWFNDYELTDAFPNLCIADTILSEGTKFKSRLDKKAFK